MSVGVYILLVNSDTHWWPLPCMLLVSLLYSWAPFGTSAERSTPLDQFWVSSPGILGTEAAAVDYHIGLSLTFVCGVVRIV